MYQAPPRVFDKTYTLYTLFPFPAFVLLFLGGWAQGSYLTCLQGLVRSPVWVGGVGSVRTGDGLGCQTFIQIIKCHLPMLSVVHY